MHPSKLSTKLSFFLTAVIIFLIDQATKILISNYADNELGLISITIVHNTGAAFGILQNNTALLAIFSIIISISLIFYVIKNNKNIDLLQTLGISLILGGTAGNLLDRIIYGYVIDFIQLNFVEFPVFNIADIAINAGVLLLIISLFLSKQEVN